MYLEWCTARGAEPWPLREEFSYRYSCHMRSAKAPPTRAQSFVKAAYLAGHSFGIQGTTEVIKSPRVGGVIWTQLMRKRVTRGRSPFTVGQVASLQTTVIPEGDDVERLLAGVASIMIAMRLRFADAQHAIEEPTLDVDTDGRGYTEMKLGSIKNARTADLVKVEKVAVGLALGLNGTPWVRE